MLHLGIVFAEMERRRAREWSTFFGFLGRSSV